MCWRRITQSGDPTIGAVYLLDAIAAVVSAARASRAASARSPVGSGRLALSLVSAVLLVSGLSTDYQYIVTGAIVIGALLAHSLQCELEPRAPNARASRPSGGGLTVKQRRSYVRPVEVAVP